MLSNVSKLSRRGVTLTEILVGIMVLGIGVISLATLFPLGLIKLRRAVNDVRGTTLAQSAWHEARMRNLVAPPLGPWFQYPPPVTVPSINPMYSPFSADPGEVDSTGTALPGFPAVNPFGVAGYVGPFRPTTGRGIPVVIDPIWMIENGIPTDPRDYRLGFVNMRNPSARTMDFYGGEGLFRTAGGFYNLALASEVFSSPDDVAYGEADRRVIPLQDAYASILPVPPTPPPYLTGPAGVPFNLGTMPRERRFSWILVARKSHAGQIFRTVGSADLPLATDDLLDNFGEDAGLDGVLGTNDDPSKPGRIMFGDQQVLWPNPPFPPNDYTYLTAPSPIGPFDVTIVVFYNRDFASQFPVFTNDYYPAGAAAEPSTARPVPIFSPVARAITIGTTVYGPFGADEATLVKRSDGIPFPDIPKGSFIMDTTLDTRPRDIGGVVTTGPIGGAVYRVVDKTINPAGTIMTLVLDRAAEANGVPVPALSAPVPGDQANGFVLTWLKGAVSAFAKQMP